MNFKRTSLLATMIAATTFGAVAASPGGPAAADRINNVVLVHGGFVDGSGWEPVYKLLKKKGFNVSIVQNPTTSLAADVAATKAVLDAQSGPVILVGHSYGGVVVTEAGNDPKVARLVYIAAFAPDKGESVQTLIANPPPGAPVPPILPPVNGFLMLDKGKFADSFAGDVAPQRAAFLADSQVPWGVDALAGAVSTAAWKDTAELVPGRYGRQDDPPDAQRGMSRRAGANAREVRGSHAVYESQPAAVADLIERAATAKNGS